MTVTVPDLAHLDWTEPEIGCEFPLPRGERCPRTPVTHRLAGDCCPASDLLCAEHAQAWAAIIRRAVEVGSTAGLPCGACGKTTPIASARVVPLGGGS